MSIPTTTLADRFRRFGERECVHVSLFYARLSLCIAADAELLAIAATGDDRGQPVPNLFFAAVQYVLLNGIDHPLTTLYPAVGGNTQAEPDPLPIFRDFCLAYADTIRALIATRLVQTNEVRRCALTMPAIALAAADQPVALIEVGASAGLNLLLDYYDYHYTQAQESLENQFNPVQADRRVRPLAQPAPAARPLRIHCVIRGNMAFLPQHIPTITWRLGLDLNPIDVCDTDATRWLQALIWPEQTERAELLRQALAIAEANPPPIWAGDAIELLPHAFAEAPTNTLLCIVHTFTLNQFSEPMRQRFYSRLAEESHRRPLAEIAVEWQEPMPPITLTHWQNGVATTQSIGTCDPHGAWIDTSNAL